MRRTLGALVAALSLGFAAVAAPVVTGTGAAKIEALPSLMNMTVWIEADGNTLDEAIAALDRKTATAAKAISALDPVDGKVTVGGPTFEPNPRSLLTRDFHEALGFALKADEGSKPVKVWGRIQAAWRLAGPDQRELLKASEMIRSVVRKTLPKDEARKQDMPADTQAAAMMTALSRVAHKPREPSFEFVALPDKATLAAARRAAFDKARENAKDTAEAAGFKIGALNSISSRVTGKNVDESVESEASSHSLGSLTLEVSVTAEFSLEGK